MSGPSVPLEAGHFAVRRDLAELALADRVFAQHYAEPMSVYTNQQTSVRTQPDVTSIVVADLCPGASFHVLDIGQSWAWGRGETPGSTGYVSVAALGLS